MKTISIMLYFIASLHINVLKGPYYHTL